MRKINKNKGINKDFSQESTIIPIIKYLKKRKLAWGMK